MLVLISDGSYLVTGKTVTGLSDTAAGVQLMPWRLEPVLKAFALRLVTGQPRQLWTPDGLQTVIDMLGV